MTAREEIDKFKNEFASLRNASAEEKEEFDKRFRNFIRSKSAEEKKLYTAAFVESAKDEMKRAKKLANYVDTKIKRWESGVKTAYSSIQ